MRTWPFSVWYNSLIVSIVFSVYIILSCDSEAFVVVHPELWLLYHNLLKNLTTKHPYLLYLFTHEQSMFTACTLNIGGVTTWQHHDHLNFRPGACLLFAIGDFDHTQGRHLILWDLKLVIEFPSSSLIIIPLALLEHLNVPISKGMLLYQYLLLHSSDDFKVKLTTHLLSILLQAFFS